MTYNIDFPLEPNVPAKAGVDRLGCSRLLAQHVVVPALAGVNRHLRVRDDIRVASSPRLRG
jgi:hypothetical protein